MNGRLLGLVFLSCWLSCGVICAQDLPSLEGWTHHIWNIADGLPDQSIEAIAQTPDGYLWLGTPHGLARYDGFEFEVTADRTHGVLQEFGVSCLLVANDGELWVGSIGGGITKISHNQIGRGYEAGSEGLTVRALYQDPSGTIWAATGHGLYSYTNNRFIKFAPLGDQVLTSITSDGEGGMWLAGARLFHLAHGQVKIVSLPYGDSDEVIHGLAITGKGQLWVGTPHGLYEMDVHGNFLHIRTLVGGIRALYSDSRGMLWIATSEQGLFMRRSDGKIVRALSKDEPISKTVRTIGQTSNGNIWVGTTAGLVRMSHSGMNLYPISTSAGADFGSIFIDPEGAVWLSAGVLTRFKGGRQAVVHVPIPTQAPIRAYFRDTMGAVWIGTLGDGCYRIFRHHVEHFTKEQLIRGFLEGADGTIWIATDAGMARWKNGVFEDFRNQVSVLGGAVRAMTTAEDGALWVGTSEGLYAIQDGKIVDPQLAHLLRHQRIWALHYGSGDMLWIGTESGLYVWHQNRLAHIDFANQETKAQSVLSILEDSQNRILLAQPGTVVRVSLNALLHAFIQARSRPGSPILQAKVSGSEEIFEVAKETGAELYGTIPFVAQADRFGGAWYASYLGLIHIDPESIHRDTDPPPLVIKQILVDGIVEPPARLLKLSSSVRTVQIEAAPILLSSRPGLQLRSRLFGWETSWNSQSPNSVSSYNKLAPGKYTYRLDANWADSDKQSEIEIEILKEGPYYRRPWFIIALITTLILLSGLVFWIFYRFKVHQLKVQFRAVTAERSRVAREIHDTLLQGCIAVYSLLETYLSIRKPNDEASEEDPEHHLLNHARDQIVETISDARTAIWNVRHAETGETLNQAINQLLSRILPSGGIDNSLDDGGQSISLPPDVQHEVMMAVREGLLNAIAHGDPRHVTIQIRKRSSGDLAIQIIDDGKGFDTSIKMGSYTDHFGLAGLKERISALEGTCIIHSVPGSGTQIDINLPAHIIRLN